LSEKAFCQRLRFFVIEKPEARFCLILFLAERRAPMHNIVSRRPCPAAGSLVLCAKIGKEQGLRRVLALGDTPDLPWQTTGNCGAQSYGD
jgi:hypothetical protein